MNRNNRLSYHNIFLLIGSLFGLMFVFMNPPWQSNDEDRHFYNAYNLAQGHLGPQVQDNKCGFILPISMTSEVKQFQSIRFGDNNKIRKNVLTEIQDTRLDPENSRFYLTPTCKLPPFPYVPAAIAMQIGSFFQSSPIWLGWWGRIGCLIAYLIITYVAIKKIPFFKPLLLLIALSPMALYQGASLSYDSLCLAFIFLFFAILISLYFQEKKISWQQVLILFLVAFLQRLSKDGYFVLFFSIAFIPISKFEKKEIFYTSILLMFVASFLPSFIWSAYLNHLHLPAEMPLQSDYLFSLSKNIDFHLKDPIHGLKLIVLNILAQGRLWIYGCIGRFGYTYVLLPTWFLMLNLIAAIFVAMSEQTDQSLKFRFRLPVALLVLLNILAIIVMLFLSGTPIGGYYLQGLQGRYFTPLLPFFLVFFFYLKKPIFKFEWMKWVLPLYITLVLMYTLNYLNSYFYFA